jgi:hypothetical protein
LYVVQRLERFSSKENNFILKTRFAICCVVKFYSTGVITQGRRIGSWYTAVSCTGQLVYITVLQIQAITRPIVFLKSLHVSGIRFKLKPQQQLLQK